jgi:hypothetical protein
MANPTLVQQNTASSAAASPASIVPTLGVASTAGNLLVLVVCVTGTTPSVTNPAGWTVIRNTVANSLAMAIYYLPNNAGGITAVTVTLGGTSGGATATILEYSNIPQAGLVLDAVAYNLNASSATPSTSLSGTIAGGGQVSQVPELLFACAYFAAATVNSNSNSAELSNSVANGVSTSGAPNAQTAAFWGLGTNQPFEQFTLNLSASVVWQVEMVRFFTSGGQYQTFLGSGRGIVSPPYNQGSIGIG